MSAMTLFDLASEIREVADKLADMGIDDQTMADTLESISLPFEQKAANVAAMGKSLEAEADAIEEAAKAMIARAKAKRSRSEWLRGYLLSQMVRAGIAKIECPWFKLAVRDNPGAVVIDNEAQIPADYLRSVPARQEVDKALIRAALKDGYDVPGAHIEVTKRLDVK